ncbi:AAA family ATPase [Vagococcus intermedius]|uniref:AAA family ATPase n=1 Tax=Vagococcus intermedius TaxID=2991418 RepID=A0AAF0CV42_9ENTE|nr:DUF4435 domain-containing protein [Vagococcus intermedius]WEG73490.1 AAA family ATPase [Vagococcus intermedius]WEG75574.1 AAA family ATPase [Vagococcus intermedius]
MNTELDTALNEISDLKNLITEWHNNKTEDNFSKKNFTILEKNSLDLLDEIEYILKNDFSNYVSNNTTVNFWELITSIYYNISTTVRTEFRSLHALYTNLYNIKNQIEKIKALFIISEVKDTIVIVGANGSGKSSFVSNLKDTSLPNLFVLPAQKYLFFSKDTHNRHDVTIDSYQDILINTNQIDIGKKDSGSFELSRTFTYPFSYLITALVKEYADITTRRHRNEDKFENKIPLWDTLETIWNELIPNISFNIDSNDRTITINKNGQKYDINGLSDGEKCILFYIGNILIAPENSYIVVDEPETFLNPSIYNKLWDLLILERPDCQFIFTSHTMDFINNRTNSTYVWCKEFGYPDIFEMEVLDKNIDFPMTLLTELVGSRKKILFCEGDYDSWDNQIYSKLFLDNYYVKPVKGHKDVIQYTKGYNEIASLHGNTAFGIIDRDFFNNRAIEKHESNNILLLPYNEIEMFLLDENIINSVLKSTNSPEECTQKFENFKNEFFKKIETRKNVIILSMAKNHIDTLIEGSLVENFTSKDGISNHISMIPTKINVDQIYNEISEKITHLLNQKDYEQLLQVCNLKGEILNGLGNTLLDSNYAERAIKRIQLDGSLRDTLKSKYFKNLIN